MAHQVIMPDWDEAIFFGDAGDILTLLESEREARRLRWPAYQCRFLVEFILPGGLYSISFYKMWNWLYYTVCGMDPYRGPFHCIFLKICLEFLYSSWVDNWAQYAWGSVMPEEVTYYCTQGAHWVILAPDIGMSRLWRIGFCTQSVSS